MSEPVRRRRERWSRSRWTTPIASLSIGALMLAAFAAAGHAGEGVGAFGLMAIVAAVFLFGGTRSETLAGLAGPGRDERWALIDTTANAVTGIVLVVAILTLWLVEIAGGEDGSPYGGLAALAGVTYILSIAWLRARS
jgi:hypothetical protein